MTLLFVSSEWFSRIHQSFKVDRGQKILLVERGKGQPPVSTFTDPPELTAIGAAWPKKHPRRMRAPTSQGESVCSVETSSYWRMKKSLADESALPPLGSRCECGVDLNDKPEFQHERGVFCGWRHFAEFYMGLPEIVEQTEESIDPALGKQSSADCQHDLHQWQPFIYARAALLCAVYEIIDARNQQQRKAA
jgi:hypothetical protein